MKTQPGLVVVDKQLLLAPGCGQFVRSRISTTIYQQESLTTMFKNLKIGVRLGAGFAIVTAMLMAIAVIGFTCINALAHDTDVIVHDRYAKVNLANQILGDVNLQARDLRNLLLVKEPSALKDYVARIEATRLKIAANVDKLQTIIYTDHGKAQLKAIVEAREKFVAGTAQMIALVNAGELDKARDYLFSDLRPLQLAYLDAAEKMSVGQAKDMETFAANAAAEAKDAKLMLLGLATVATLFAAALGFLITRAITGPIAAAVKVAQTVAAGDLTSQIHITSTDETGQLLSALKSMNESLVKVVGQVRQSSDRIATGSGQIASGNADLSQRTEEQASNLQQTAASMEQLTSTVKNNSDTARQATQLAGSARAAATQGGLVVGQVVSTMEAITASSKKISDIISVIDGIAFQTNILALNAAVEAARAGEQGRGFAVVASEVRNLAQRSAAAAKEIKTLISRSVETVDAGSQQVSDAGRAMTDIVMQVKRVNDLIAEISSATIEQTQGIGQVGDAIHQLDQVTQQNAALVEESAAAAESLSQQAARLVEAVSLFKLGDGVR